MPFQNDFMPRQRSEQEIERRQSRETLIQLGIDPYPAERFDINTTAAAIKENFDKNPEAYQQVSIAGRIMSRRIMGKASFAELMDSSGRIQLYITRDELCPSDDKSFYDYVFKKLIDIGDILGVKGYVFRTKTGEITIHVNTMKILCKSLRPLPIVKKDAEGNIHDAFTDPELRYRQRYVDLIVNEGVREIFIKRTRLIHIMREFFNQRGYLEVETPVLQPIPGGAAARPFVTHHNALDIDLYLRIANELYLKRLIVGGFDGVYEFSRNFRNEGMDRTHNPEFTAMEIYVAYKDYFWMMEFTEELMAHLAMQLNGSYIVKYGEREIDFRPPYPRITMYDAIEQHTGIDISMMNEEQLRQVCKQLHIETTPAMGKGKLIDEIFSKTCEDHFINPTFIIDYPVEMSPLCKKHRGKPGIVERFELIINGKEIANAYSELNDPVDQLERFEEQVKLMERGDEEAMYIDYDFLRALEYGMPPTSGMGIGIDRLTMIFTNQHAIQEVLLFPQMRPEKLE